MNNSVDTKLKQDYKVYGADNTPIGEWKVKLVKPQFLYEYLKPITFHKMSFMNDMYRNYIAGRLANLVNVEIPRKALCKVVIKYLLSESKSKGYLSIKSIEKYFNQTKHYVDKDFLLYMVKKGYLSKSYHKVCITKKGIDLIIQN